jgi:hypothetical protein
MLPVVTRLEYLSVRVHTHIHTVYSKEAKPMEEKSTLQKLLKMVAIMIITYTLIRNHATDH